MSNCKYQILNKPSPQSPPMEGKHEVQGWVKRLKNYSSGQTLVTLLFFMVIALTITTGAIIIIFVNTQGQTKVQQSQSAYYVAESGMENALIELLRNPAYTGESNLSIGEGIASISATLTGSVQSGTVYATSSGTVGNFVRKIQVTGTYTNNVFSVQSWKEIF